jgi:hypothetical protein
VRERLYLLRGKTDTIYSVLKYTRHFLIVLLVNIDWRGGKAFSVDCFAVVQLKKGVEWGIYRVRAELYWH